MSMQIRFIKNPKGVLAVDAEPGTVRWVSRPLALQLLRQGFAEVYAPTEHGRYETAEVAPEEQEVIKPGKPKRRGRPKKDEPTEPEEKSEPKQEAEPPAEPPEPDPAPDPKEPSAAEPPEDKSGVDEDLTGLSGIPSAEEVFKDE